MPTYKLEVEVTQKKQVTVYVEDADSAEEAKSRVMDASPFSCDFRHEEHEGTTETLDWDVESVEEIDEEDK